MRAAGGSLGFEVEVGDATSTPDLDHDHDREPDLDPDRDREPDLDPDRDREPDLDPDREPAGAPAPARAPDPLFRLLAALCGDARPEPAREVMRLADRLVALLTALARG